jgi:WD40 repeat protein
MYNARTGVQKGSFPAQSGPLTALKLSADGRLLVVLGRDGHARVWDVTVGKEIYDYQLLGARVPYLDLSLDGKLLLASAHPKTHMVALYSAGEPKPFILAGGEVGFGRHHGAISPDGTRAAVGDAGNNVCLYDTMTHKQLCVLRTRSSPVRLAFSPDGNQLAVGEVTGLVTLWGLASQQVVRVLKGHEATIFVLAFAPNGRRLVSFDGNAVIRCWDLGVDEESRVLVKNDDQINSLSYSPDGRLLVAASQGQVRVHNLRSQDPPQSLSIGGTRTAVFSPDGRTIAGGMGGPLSLWQVETGHHLNLSSHLPEEIGLVVFSPDGRWLAVGFGGPTDFSLDKPGKVMLFDVENRKEHRTWPSTTQVSALAFSPDGALLAAAGHDGTIRFWRTADWNELNRWEGPPGTAYASVLFLSGGQKLAAGNDAGTVDIWDVGTGRLAMRLSGHGSCVPVMALSPDGRTLATGSWDRLIKLWDAGTGRELRTLRGHESWLYALAFSPDGNTLASSGVDGVLRLWEAPSAQAVAEMHVPRGLSIVD